MLELISDKRQTLKSFTDNQYAQGSFFFTQLKKNKDIKVNGKRVSRDVTIEKGDVVTYYTSLKQEEKPAFYVVYEDENILVIDKESGVNSEAVFSALARARECYFIHRLDRNTSGLMVFALNEIAATSLLNAFKGREIEKKYHALCFGVFPKEREVLTAYLKKDAEKSLVKLYNKPVAGSEPIITEYLVLSKKDEDLTKVEIILHTGKTHQIRAHLSYLGCPIVGDMKYGDIEKNKEKNIIRQCLISKSLRLCLQGELCYLKEKTFVSRFEL